MDFLKGIAMTFFKRVGTFNGLYSKCMLKYLDLLTMALASIRQYTRLVRFLLANYDICDGFYLHYFECLGGDISYINSISSDVCKLLLRVLSLTRWCKIILFR